MIKINNDRPILLNFLSCIYSALWTLLLIVPGVIKSLSYTLAIKFVSEDDEIGYNDNDALKKSSQEMEGHKMSLFL